MLAGGVDADGVARKTDETLADNPGRFYGGLEGNEVAAGELVGEKAVGEPVFEDDFSGVGEGWEHGWTVHLFGQGSGR